MASYCDFVSPGVMCRQALLVTLLAARCGAWLLPGLAPRPEAWQLARPAGLPCGALNQAPGYSAFSDSLSPRTAIAPSRRPFGTPAVVADARTPLVLVAVAVAGKPLHRNCCRNRCRTTNWQSRNFRCTSRRTTWARNRWTVDAGSFAGLRRVHR